MLPMSKSTDGPRVERNCLVCRKVHWPRTKEVDRGWGKFCSRICSDAHQRCMTIAERFEGKFTRSDSCWLWHGFKLQSPFGYGLLWIRQPDGGRLPRLAHRISWEIYRGKIPAGLFVLHKCDTPLCVNPEHLFLGTQSDNMNDMYYKGRGKKPKVLTKVSSIKRAQRRQRALAMQKLP